MQDITTAQLGPFAVEVQDLVKSFRGKTALNQVTFSAKDGEMLALLGAPGSGKSTLLRNINGLHQADWGTVSIFGKTLQSEGKFHSHVRRLHSQIGFIFPADNLVGWVELVKPNVRRDYGMLRSPMLLAIHNSSTLVPQA